MVKRTDCSYRGPRFKSQHPHGGKELSLSRVWYHMPLILALRRQRQVDLCGLKASLVYRMMSRQAGTIRRPSLKKKNNCHNLIE